MAKFSITLDIDNLDLDAWAMQYGITVSEAKNDVAIAAQQVFADYLARVGFIDAEVLERKVK